MEITIYVDNANLVKALRNEIFSGSTLTTHTDRVPLKFDSKDWHTGCSSYLSANSVTFFPNEKQKDDEISSIKVISTTLIEQLNFSDSTYNALRECGIREVGELLKISKREFIRIFGPEVTIEIDKILKTLGLLKYQKNN
ncbi:DNA-directed RNA polymerase subunit alpha [compost metagenome]